MVYPAFLLPSTSIRHQAGRQQRRQEVSHCGGRVPRHKASDEPERQEAGGEPLRWTGSPA
ncbi:MAG: hypothetical protein KME50_09705 [Nostoc desertorum CM1-VF14]|nr:hypothetical protein [Nostoc desertorum CM1-VF14]